ncbi:hypothetical protein EG68_06750 [Paragonimus skrjabini miyazakii]|uniref:Uncharacterized protein n=1 Tax=Paragonimus skrjabini miyazakii TaxID=59628 RepID=A0A8S9YNR7_9TREM|nr:hypothetical protein EG68_06750 [Paragonimus skrjabini miyazakii]
MVNIKTRGIQSTIKTLYWTIFIQLGRCTTAVARLLRIDDILVPRYMPA